MGNGNRLYEKAVQICESIKRGEDTAAAVAEIEPELKRFHKRENINGMNLCYVQDALYDVSDNIKRYWDRIYDTFKRPEDRYEALIRFVNARETYLGASHESSINILRKIGWTPADIMAAYLHHRCGSNMLLPLSPDIVAEAAREDMDTALLLLEGKEYERFFPSFGKGYDIYKHFEWIDFLYYFMEYEDRTFLKAEHKNKRLCRHCEHVREILDNGAARSEAELEGKMEAKSETRPEAGQKTKSVSQKADIPDFTVFQNAVLQQKHLMASAARQKLRKGNDQDGYYVKSFHLLDEERGFGAALCFEALNRASEYGTQTGAVKGVYFYLFPYPILFDYIPESRRCNPQELPEEFVNQAFLAFAKAAGLAKGR